MMDTSMEHHDTITERVVVDGDEMELPAAPDGLSQRAREWWFRILADHDLDAAGLLLLEQAMRWLDIEAQMRETLARRRGTIDPRTLAALMAKMDNAGRHVRNSLRCLNLDINPSRANPGRPPAPL